MYICAKLCFECGENGGRQQKVQFQTENEKVACNPMILKSRAEEVGEIKMAKIGVMGILRRSLTIEKKSGQSLYMVSFTVYQRNNKKES